MFELTPDQFSLALPLFTNAHYGALVAATLEGTHPGRVFIDHLDAPTAALVCLRAGLGYYFLAGSPTQPFTTSLREAFQDDFLPAQKAAMQNPEVVLFYEPPALQPELFDALANYRPRAIFKKRFILHHPTVPPLAAPEGLQIVPYSPELLAVCPHLSEEACLFYGSYQAFLHHSLGFCVMDGEIAASCCSAVLIGAGEAEISIATVPDYRRKGLAYLAAQAFIAACLKRGLAPIWGCWPENAPSVALARKLGFVEDIDQPACLWVDMPDWNR